MNLPAMVASVVLVGIAGFIGAHETRRNTSWHTTARKALLLQILFFLMVVGGIYAAFQIPQE